MLSEFQKLKIAHGINTVDADGNGYIERSDLQALADRLCEVRGYEPGTASFSEMHEAYEGLWQSIKGLDSDGDGRVSLEEHYQVYGYLSQVYRNGGEEAAPILEQLYGMVDMYASLMDSNGDGQIDIDELMVNLRAYYNIRDADKTFQHLDLDGNGNLDKDELRLLVEQFYFEDDPTAPGNWLWGRLPEKNPYE